MNRNTKPAVRMFVALVVGVVLAQSMAAAQVSTFTSRPAWEAALAGSAVWLQDFEGFTADAQFRTGPVSAGPFTLRQVGSGSLRNVIDVPAFEFPDNNGTRHASLFTNFGITSVDMAFSAPVLAWGADFFGTTSGELLDLDLVLESGAVLATVPVAADTGFFGFITDRSDVIGRVTFKSRTNITGSVGEGFGIDNVVGVIPEPGSATLLGMGALSIIGYGGRRRKR